MQHTIRSQSQCDFGAMSRLVSHGSNYDYRGTLLVALFTLFQQRFPRFTFLCHIVLRHVYAMFTPCLPAFCAELADYVSLEYLRTHGNRNLSYQNVLSTLNYPMVVAKILTNIHPKKQSCSPTETGSGSIAFSSCQMRSLFARPRKSFLEARCDGLAPLKYEEFHGSFHQQ